LPNQGLAVSARASAISSRRASTAVVSPATLSSSAATRAAVVSATWMSALRLLRPERTPPDAPPRGTQSGEPSVESQ
jgi:hypothetical protein